MMKNLGIGFLLMQLAGCLSPQDKVKSYIIAYRCTFDHHVETRRALDPYNGKVKVWEGWSVFNCPQSGDYPESHPYVYDVDGKPWRP
jgi:hypothetical protein